MSHALRPSFWEELRRRHVVRAVSVSNLVDTFQEMETWDYWPTLAVRYLFPGVLGSVRGDPRFQGILDRVEESWGAAPGSETAF